MGTEVDYKNLFLGYYNSMSMRNVNEDSNSRSLHLFYGNNTLTNGHYYDGFTPTSSVTNAYLRHEKDELKQKMLQHEAVFKNQVYELHRLYTRQRDMMEEIKRKEFHKYQIFTDTTSSLSFMPSQKGGHKWQIPIGNNGLKDCEIVECRPSKVRKKLFDLQFPAHEYIEPEEGDNQTSEISSYTRKEHFLLPKNGVKTFLDDPGQNFKRSNGLTDLNEPADFQEATALSSVDFLGLSAKPGKEVQHRGIYSEISSQIQGHSHFNQNPLLFSSSSGYPFISTTTNMGNSWSPSGPSWGKSNNSLTRKLTSFQSHPSFKSSPHKHEVVGDKWHRNGCYGTSTGARNGFYNGSSSGSKEVTGFDYRNVNKINDGSQKIFKGPNFVDLTDTTEGMDLNSVQTLPNEDENSRKCDQMVFCKNGDNLSKEKDDSLATNKKLLGFPIFGNFCISKNDASIEHRGIDINVAWDERKEETDAEIKNFKNNFDLNSCVTDVDDDLLVTECVKTLKTMRMEIDLEAPAVSEIEEEEAIECENESKETELKPDNPENKEFEKIAALAIIAMSSQQDHVGSTDDNEDSDNPLLWFVEEINIISITREMDEYEMLNLQLEKTKEEDYMPTPLVTDFQEPEEVGPALTRPRRGQSRRGRPRRDFQRDILPGMASLSRHEITEDLQIFGGLMRATGYSWNLGSIRRNPKKVGARGRWKVKAVEITPATPPPPPPSSTKYVEVVGLDEISLTGWGKTTRRPRRQRCAAGNSVAVQLT